MDRTEISDEEAVERVLRIISARHAKRAMANVPNLDDPSAVVAWIEAAARAAEEEFDQLMGYVPAERDMRREKVRQMIG